MPTRLEEPNPLSSATADMKIKRALLSVYDKTGIVDFARALVDEYGIEILSTGGTAKLLRESDDPRPRRGRA